MDEVELARAVKTGGLSETAFRLEKEFEAAKEISDDRKGAVASNDLGVVYYLIGDFEQARARLENSRDQFAKLGDSAGLARALGNLARIEERCRHRQQALALYQQAADLFHEAHANEDEFATLRSLSQLCLKMGGWMQALAAYDRGLTIKPHGSLFDRILHWLYQIPLRMMALGAG